VIWPAEKLDIIFRTGIIYVSVRFGYVKVILMCVLCVC